ncbi:MAG TPA: glycosyltransferase family 2 protein [Candidatus Binatia bacterium]|nr:glycosyltransferase family 2 protein [Candidatus Binatia bacterium]
MSPGRAVPHSRDAAALRAPDAPSLPGLSAFVPVHDEVETLPGVVAALVAVLPQVAERWELVIVDDGSRDGTAAVADAFARRHAHVRVVRHAQNRGYGAALQTGLLAARYDTVFWMDGDGQFDPHDLPRLAAALDGVDAVVGWRRQRADPWRRRLNTALWNRLVRTLFRLPVRDVNCAFKLLRRDALAGIAPEASGAMISTELLARLVQRGCIITEMPVRHLPRRAGTPSGAAPRVVARAFVELLRLARRLRRRNA